MHLLAAIDKCSLGRSGAQWRSPLKCPSSIADLLRAGWLSRGEKPATAVRRCGIVLGASLLELGDFRLCGSQDGALPPS